MYLVPFLGVGYNIPSGEEVRAWSSFRFYTQTLVTILVLLSHLVTLSVVSLLSTGTAQTQLWRHFMAVSPRDRGDVKSVGEKVIVKGRWSRV